MSSIAFLSAASAAALEFPSLLRLVAQHASTDLGRDRVAGLEPATDRAAWQRHRRRHEEVERLLLDGVLVPSAEAEYGALLTRLEGGHPPLSGADLVRLAELLRTTAAARMRCLDAAPPCPELAALAAPLADGEPLRQRIERALDRRGGVREDASPRLAALRSSIRRLRDELYRELQVELGELRDQLSEETIPLRNNRLVLVLQAGARGQAKGLVHGRSATGKSVYFEPLAVVEPNNQLQQSLEDDEAERQRIVAELVGAAREALPLLHAHAELLAELDLLQAAVGFARDCGGRLAEAGGDDELRLVGARHPLLDPRLAATRQAALGQGGHRGPIVPLDLELGAGQRVLVVTGPNAGGKTVALKTVGLLAVAHQCGLPVPAAAGSRLPFLRRLVATVGDEQDLLSDRSTFSGRLLRLKEAWEAAGPGSLLLLDELGSGTDPEEGSALAVALLEGLLRRGGLGLLTTHLARLAAAALDLPGSACAAMEFSPSSGAPTFRLVPGPPGGSEAIALARRLGLAADWIARAEALLGPEHRDLRRLLAEVERARDELLAARERADVEASDLAKIRARVEGELAALETERRSLAPRLRAELETFRRDTQRKLADEVARLRAEWQEGRRKNLASAATERLFESAPALAPAQPEAPGPLRIGGTVRHRTLGWQGRLDSLADGRAEVLVRGKRLRCDEEDLVGLADDATRVERPRRGAEREVPSVEPELMLIGVRVEPALEALDGYLDRALLAGRESVRVVHGHGSGRMRDAVRAHLRQHPAVLEQRPGAPNEGGNGATVVVLRRD